MGEHAKFYVRPRLRCCQPKFDPARVICGEPARWRRPAPAGTVDCYFCPEHAAHGDVPIAGVTLFRRVQIVAEVTFAGVSAMPALARAEALARLERAVEEAGGMLNLHAMTDVIGSHEPETPRQAAALRRFGGQ